MGTSDRKSAEAIEAEAAAWAARLDAAPDHPHPELDIWFAQDPKHAGALLRAQAALALFTPAKFNHEAQAEDTQSVRHHPETPAPSRWRRLAFAGGGTAIAAASLIAFLLIWSPSESYATQIGEVRTLSLSDGSSVSIDAKSRIDISFNDQKRDVHLKFGKVLFRVAHNAQRPFRVIVGDIVITDMGTGFQITNDEASGEVEVLVTDGAVVVDTPDGRINLMAGQQARFSKAALGRTLPTPARITPMDIDRNLAWREGRLELNGDTLDSAVAEINRHSRIQLRVTSAGLGRENLYGSFRMNDAAGFARAVATGLGAEVRTEQDGIVITPAKNKHQQ